jgi:hypothetical protein
LLQDDVSVLDRHLDEAACAKDVGTGAFFVKGPDFLDVGSFGKGCIEHHCLWHTKQICAIAAATGEVEGVVG